MVRIAVARRHNETRHVLADHFRSREPECLTRSVVPIDDVSSAIHHDDRIECGVENKPPRAAIAVEPPKEHVLVRDGRNQISFFALGAKSNGLRLVGHRTHNDDRGRIYCTLLQVPPPQLLLIGSKKPATLNWKRRVEPGEFPNRHLARWLERQRRGARECGIFSCLPALA